jgi:hypothetical protein
MGGFTNVIGFAIVAGLVGGLAFGRGNKAPKRIAPVRWRELFRPRPLVVGLLVGILAGQALILLFRATTAFGVPAVLWPGLVAELLAWLGAGLVAGMSRPGTDNTSPLSPLSSWRADRAVGLTVGLGVGLAFGLGVGLALGVSAGLVSGLVYPQSWSSSLAFAQFTASDRTPVRLMRFLEDAHSRGVLRTVGPAYQFRHARLQDRLATQELATAQDPGEPRPAAADTATPTAETPPASAR